MKKIATTIFFTIFILSVKAQTPTLNTLIKYVSMPLTDVTEEIVNTEGWELSESEVLDSAFTLTFMGQGLTLIASKYKEHDNDVYLFCGKPTYDLIYKSILSLNPQLVNSKVDNNGHIVKNFWDEKYGYQVTILPKSHFSFKVYNKVNPILMDIENENSNSINENLMIENVEGSGFGDTPIALRRFTNLDLPQDDGTKTGKIAVRLKINKSGVVIDATPGVKGTTLNDRVLWQRCKDAIMGARLNQSESAPDVQLGVVVFNFKSK